MNPFELLRGGANFNKKRFAKDIEIFQKREKVTPGTIDPSQVTDQLAEIDFFNTTHTVVGKSKTPKKKAEKVSSAESDSKTADSTPPDTKAAVFRSEKEAKVFRRERGIHVEGTDVPNPFRQFEDLQYSPYSLNPVLFKNLLNCKYTTPTPIQMQSVPVMLKGRDLMACAPTGSGKTLGYLLPLIHDLNRHEKIGFRALIIAPTRELTLQIEREFKNMSMGSKLNVHVLGQTTAADANLPPNQRKKFDVLISTPGRLVYAIKDDSVDLSHVRHLVLDEADKLLEQGFLEQTDEIFAACSGKAVRRSLFSATFSPTVEDLAQSVMNNPVRVTIGAKNAATDVIEQQLKFTGDESGKLFALREFIKSGFAPPVLIFVQSIDRSKQLFHELVYEGVRAQVIHSECTKKQRDDIIDQFRQGNIWVLIATELMARGLDFKGVNCVINYDFPQTVESYIHRIGRTGRAGRAGLAITYVTRNDTAYLKNIVPVMKESGCDVPDWMNHIKNPNPRTAKQMAKGQIMRKPIDTKPAYDKRLQAKRKSMIEASKKRKKTNAADNKNKEKASAGEAS